MKFEIPAEKIDAAVNLMAQAMYEHQSTSGDAAYWQLSEAKKAVFRDCARWLLQKLQGDYANASS